MNDLIKLLQDVHYSAAWQQFQDECPESAATIERIVATRTDAVYAGFTQGTIKPLGPHTQLQQMIEQLYQEADEMEQDTMVSMVEGTYNEIFANRLRNIAARLELIK